MSEPGKNTTPMRLMVWSHPRTVSSMFQYIFKSEENKDKLNFDSFYFLFEAYYFSQEKPWPHDLRYVEIHPVYRDKAPKPNELYKDETFQKAYERIRAAIEKGEKEGRIFFHKEHIIFYLDPEVAAKHLPKEQGERLLANLNPNFKNKKPLVVDNDYNEELLFPKREGETECPLFIPESLLRTYSPVFMIRHPGLVFPSYYRLATLLHGLKKDDPFAPVDFSLKWSRLLFDWYRSIGAEDPWPIVIDAEDLVKNPNGVVKLFKEKTGLDIAGRYEWEQRMPGDKPPLTFAGVLHNSTKVIRDPRYDKPVVLEDEKVKWVEEWDEDVADYLYNAAKDALSDYEYMRQFRLQPVV